MRAGMISISIGLLLVACEKKEDVVSKYEKSFSAEALAHSEEAKSKAENLAEKALVLVKRDIFYHAQVKLDEQSLASKTGAGEVELAKIKLKEDKAKSQSCFDEANGALINLEKIESGKRFVNKLSEFQGYGMIIVDKLYRRSPSDEDYAELSKEVRHTSRDVSLPEVMKTDWIGRLNPE